MENYVCIHGHFYQPPRENPWLEAIEEQDSAAPYHDWNQRISSECYGPNSTATVVDKNGKIIDISNNYSQMSFNFGPTLLSWMKEKNQTSYDAIIEADKKSQENFSGHGSAIAQCYNHLIMPLANYEDKKTQILWGIRDFEFRFSRKPLGMWLPETAVDSVTLELLAENGIKFTILSPYQAKAYRLIGEKDWNPSNNFDTKRPYLYNLPSGKNIVLFFYDGNISQEIAFGKLLDNGDLFAESLIKTLKKQNEISHIAVDGETFGHHHKFGEMALAYFFKRIGKEKNVKNIIYSLFLEKNKPLYEAEIIENSSWSCAHGVGRWKEDCGCCLSYNPKWNQKWRADLRKAMDFLRDALIPLYNEKMSLFTKDPWKIRNDYINVILDRSKPNVESFFTRNCPGLRDSDKVTALKLLEMQRMCMLMYTSCGWFFDDISSIESLQILLYAARAIQLSKDFGASLEEKFLSILENAKSNSENLKNGAFIYETLIKPKIFDLSKIGAHYTISSLFEKREPKEDIYCYTVETPSHEIVTLNEKKLSFGKATIFSKVTWEKLDISFVAIHYAEQNVLVGISDNMDEKQFLETSELIKNAFNSEDIEHIKNVILERFTAHHFSFWDLFPDDQRKILKKILFSTLSDLKSSLSKAHRLHFDLIESMKEKNIPLPKLLVKGLDLMINTRLLEILEKPEINLSHLKRICEVVKEWSFEIDNAHVSYHALKHVEHLLEEFYKDVNNIEYLKILNELFEILDPLSLTWNLCRVQSFYFSIFKTVFVQQNEKALKGNEESKIWVEHFKKVGIHLKIKVE